MIIFLPNFPSECRSRYQRCMVVFGVLRYNKEVRETVEQVDQCDCYMYRKWLLHPAFVSSPRVELTLASTAALKTQMPSNKGGDTLVPFPPPSCVSHCPFTEFALPFSKGPFGCSTRTTIAGWPPPLRRRVGGGHLEPCQPLLVYFCGNTRKTCYNIVS